MELMQANREWANRPEDQRFTSMADLTAAVKARRLVSRQREATMNKVRIVQDGETLKINGQHAAATLTHWSFGQLATRLGAPAGYLRTLPTEKTCDLLNHHLVKAADDDKGLILFHGNEPSQYKAQAVTSPTYGRIWDADVCDAVQRVVDGSGGKFHNPLAYDRVSGGTKPSGLYASDRDCFIFMIDGGSVLEAGPRAELSRGFFAWNSEVGSSTFGLMTFMFNHVCGNHIIWGASNVQTVKIRHTSGGPGRFINQAGPALLDYVNASSKPIETAIKAAQAYALPAEDDNAWARLTDGFTKGEIKTAREYAEREEGRCYSLWDLVQGLTASAREMSFMDARIDLEKRAGKLLDVVK